MIKYPCEAVLQSTCLFIKEINQYTIIIVELIGYCNENLKYGAKGKYNQKYAPESFNYY